MVAPAGIDAGNAPEIAGGIINLLRDGAGTADAVRWAEVCSGSGYCIPACEYGINPRFMIALARAKVRRLAGVEAAHVDGTRVFTGMTRGVRVLSRLQLSPDVLARVNPRPRRGRRDGAPADLVFYTGCNILRTPHIALLCLDVLDRLGVRYEVMGGTAHCCGIFQYRAGDVEGAGRVGFNTIDRLAGAGTQEVLSWCPTCQTQFGEATLPAYAEAKGESPFDLTPFIAYISGRLDVLKPLMTHSVERRVALHERPVLPGVMEAARTILRAIPGLTLIDLDVPRVGTQSNSLSVLPEFKKELREKEFAAADAAGVDTLATIFHACHRELCHYDSGQSFEIVNFMELLGESLGIRHDDLYKRLKLMRDVDAVIRDSDDLIEQHGLDLDEVRDVIFQDMLSGQSVGVAPIGDAGKT